jgi:hypothetical protein
MKKQIHDALSKLLSKKLEKHLQSKLDKESCISIYQDIFDTVVGVFQESGVEISNEAVNLVSQMYYDSVKINSSQELDPSIFTQRAKTDLVTTKELAMLSTLFNGTPFGDIFIHAVKRRS